MASQQLIFSQTGQRVRTYSISSAANGCGQLRSSGKTPLGRHIIRAKIGADKPLGAVFVGRRPTGEIFTPDMLMPYPGHDWVLTRILWLSGVETGINRLGNVDTMGRYIYIHGTADEDNPGQPVSHGCIRMANLDVIELFENTPINTSVTILEGTDD